MAFFLAAAVGLSLLSAGASIKAGREQKKANRATNKIRERQASKERLSEIRQNKITSAMSMANSTNSGTAGTSSAQGALASIGSQTAANLGFINAVSSLQSNVARFQNKAITNQGQATAFGTLGNVAGQLSVYANEGEET